MNRHREVTNPKESNSGSQGTDDPAHERFIAFANGPNQDPLEHRNLHGTTGKDSASEYLPTQAALLEQLRKDALQTEKKYDKSLKDSPWVSDTLVPAGGRAAVAEGHILAELDTVKQYDAKQLKDVADITKAVQNNDEKTINSVLDKYKGDPDGFDKLQAGMTLELERRGLDQSLQLGVGMYTDKQGNLQPELDVYYSSNNQIQTSKQFKADD